jgi:1-acyl-sn-glycerol-3-phosphate acyltransferase
MALDAALANAAHSAHPQRVFERSWYRAGRVAMDLVKHLVFNLDVIYHQPVPDGGKLLAANHPSTTDPAMMTTLVPEQVSILINEVLFKVPVFGRSLKMSGHIRVDLCNGRPALEAGLRYLSAGRTLGIFPEGVISPEHGMAPVHTGAARLALASGVPVIPIGFAVQPAKLQRIKTRVDGREEEASWYLNGGYAITVGEAVRFQGDPEDRTLVNSVTGQLVQRIEALSRESAARLAARRTFSLRFNPVVILRLVSPAFA